MKALLAALCLVLLTHVASAGPYASHSTGYTGIAAVVGQLMSSGYLAGWIQRHVLHQGFAPETTDALLQQQWWRRVNARPDGSGATASASKDYSFVDCTPLYQVERSWSTWILNVRVHVPMCASVCLDYPSCSTSVPIFVGHDDRALKTTQFCDVTVVGEDGSHATTVTLNASATTTPEKLCRNIVDAPRALQGVTQWRAVMQASSNATLRKLLSKGQELKVVTVAGPTSTSSPMIAFPDLWTHMTTQPMQLHGISDDYQGWQILRELQASQFQPTSVVKNTTSTSVNALLTVAFVSTGGSSFGWQYAYYLIPVGTSNKTWVTLTAYAVDQNYRNQLNGPCGDTDTQMASYVQCLQQQGTVSWGTAAEAGCWLSGNALVWLGDGRKGQASSSNGSSTSDSGKYNIIGACGTGPTACQDRDPPVFTFVTNEPGGIGDGQPCPFYWGAADGCFMAKPALASFMYPAGAQLGSAAFRASARDVQQRWAAGTIDDQMLRDKLQLVNLSALSADEWMSFTYWDEDEVRRYIFDRLDVLIVQSSSYAPPLPTGAVFLTAMSGQFVAVASVFGLNFAILDQFILARLSLFGRRWRPPGKPGDAARDRLIVLFFVYVVAFMMPLVPPTIAAWATLRGISRVVPLTVPQSVQYAQLLGSRRSAVAYLVTQVQPYAEISVRYGTVAAVTAVLIVVVIALAAWTSRKVWSQYREKGSFISSDYGRAMAPMSSV